MTDLPSGDYYVGQYGDNGRVTRHQMISVRSGETSTVDWVERGTVTVEGRVSQSGKPVADVDVRANYDKPGTNWAGSTKTDKEGRYKLTLHETGGCFFSAQLGEWVDPNHIYCGKLIELASGTNRLDFELPCGSISGKLVDATTNKPLVNTSIKLYSHQTYEQHMGRPSLYVFADAERRWWPENETKTDKNGSFQVGNLKAGKWMVCAVRGSKSRGIPAAVVTLKEGEAKTGVIAKVPPTGSAHLTAPGIQGARKNTSIVCVGENGMVYYPEFADGAYQMDFSELPVGKYKAIPHDYTGRHLPLGTPFQVQRNKTAEVAVKLTKGPRIVFRPEGDPAEAGGAISVSFRITSPDGKPVLEGIDGLKWGDMVGGLEASAEPHAISIRPGKYLLTAIALHGRESSWGDERKPGKPQLITVEAGKDTVVEVPWGD